MTLREERVLSFIASYQQANNGVSPSLDEIASGIGLKARSGAHGALAGLIRQGRVRREGVRDLHIVPFSVDLSKVPDRALIREYVARFGVAHVIAEAA